MRSLGGSGRGRWRPCGVPAAASAPFQAGVVLAALAAGGAAGASLSSWRHAATLAALVAPKLAVGSCVVAAWSVGAPDPLQ